jgi:hypothetical protein
LPWNIAGRAVASGMWIAAVIPTDSHCNVVCAESKAAAKAIAFGGSSVGTDWALHIYTLSG